MRRWMAITVLALLALTAVSVYGFTHDKVDVLAPVHQQGRGPIQIVRDVLPAWAFIAAGLLAWWRRPANRTGLLMIGVGAAWLVNGLEFLPTSPFTTLGVWLGAGAGLFGVMLGLLILAYPRGEIRSRAGWTWIGMSAVYLAIQAGIAVYSPGARGNCECRSSIILRYDQPTAVELINLADLWFALMAVVLLAILVRRWLRASQPARRAAVPVWVAGAVITFVAVTGESYWSGARTWNADWLSTVPSLAKLVWGDRDPVVWMILPWVQAVSLLLVPAALLWGLLGGRLRQSAVAGLAVDLGRLGGSSDLVNALRRALGDPSLTVAYWSRPAQSYVTEAGEALTLPADDPARSTTKLSGEDGQLAALIHDPALDDQRALVDGVAAVARLALENERLHAEVKAQLEEVRASRERIVRAADEERRRVERNLHDGAQQRLVSLSLALTMAQAQMRDASPQAAATIAEAEQELRLAIGELRELARGIHPAILGDSGLGPALEALADRSPVPVRLESRIEHRHSPIVEATAYFVAAEALTNVAKYALATSVEVSTVESDGWLQLTVRDDGVGGADPSGGSGLRGLFDRVAAVGGRLSIESLAGHGTRLVAEIPCA